MSIDLTAWFGVEVASILALVAADVLAGVFAAMKQGMFEWRRLADFYETNVIPKLGGWLVTAIVARFVAPQYLVGPIEVLGPGIEGVAFAAVVIALGASIIDNLRTIGSISA